MARLPLAAAGRASDFFGPRVLVSAAGKQVFARAVAVKSAQVAGDPDQPYTYTYMPDIGKRRHAWHLLNPETLTTREFVHMIFEEAGGEPRMQRAPKPLLWTLRLFNPALRETIEMLYEFEEPFVVDHSAFARAFGDHATPLGEAIRRTMRWHRDERSPGYEQVEDLLLLRLPRPALVLSGGSYVLIYAPDVTRP